jgi:hypothetical protein
MDPFVQGLDEASAARVKNWVEARSAAPSQGVLAGAAPLAATALLTPTRPAAEHRVAVQGPHF